MFFFRKQPKLVSVYCDGAIGDDRRAAGAGVVIRDEQNEIIGLVKRGLPPMTNNEAEYAALALALEAVGRLRPRTLKVYMDSEVVVGQMRGRFTVNSAALKRWHTQACQLARRFREISYIHIPREANRLADALANEAWTEEVKRRRGEEAERRRGEETGNTIAG
jgi:ribonuclease HI